MNSNCRKLLLSAGLLFCLGLAASVPSARAVTVSPVTFELFAQPGETVNSQVRISNESDSSVAVSMGAESFVPIGEEGRVALDDSEEHAGFSLASWIEMNKTSFTLQPKDIQIIDFAVNVPLNAEFGGYYASILARTSADTSGGGVGVAQKIGALLLMQVAGDVEEQLRVKSFTAPNFSEYGPVTITARFENSGSVHLKPRGDITLKNAFGKEVAKVDMPQNNVLPDSIRKIEVPIGERDMFGKYTANMLVIYGSTNEPLSAQVSFWVIPWKITLLVLAGLVILLVFLYRGRVRLRKALRILFKGE